MSSLVRCRRSIVACIGIACLTYLGHRGAGDACYAIAGICAAVCGANAYEKKGARGISEPGANT